MKYSNTKLLLLFFFRHSAFIEASEAYLKWLNTPEALEIKSKTMEEAQSVRAASEIHNALSGSFWRVAASIIIGAIIGRIIVGFHLLDPRYYSEVTQYLGIAILLWATLGKVGWHIQTLNGTTLPERVNEVIFRLLYIAGSLSLALSASLSFGIST